jgi:hypothetical protein
MFTDGRRRGQNAATVYRRIARSLLRILTAMPRTGQPYDETRYIASPKANGVPGTRPAREHATLHRRSAPAR